MALVVFAVLLASPVAVLAITGEMTTAQVPRNADGAQGIVVYTAQIAPEYAGTLFRAHITNLTGGMESVNLAFAIDGVRVAYGMFIEEGNVIQFNLPQDAQEFTIIASTNSRYSGTFYLYIEQYGAEEDDYVMTHYIGEIPAEEGEEMATENEPADVPTEAAAEESAPQRLIALTFDDGPFAHTDVLLDILEEHDVLATFFFIGQHIPRQPEMAQRVFEAGHEIGNHSWTHISLGNADPDIIRQELGDTSTAIREITGEYPTLFRAPYLNHGANLTAVATEMDMAIISAGIMSNDWESITYEQVANNVIGAARDGGIILLHEQFSAGNRRTKDALPIIINTLRADGFEFVTVSELAERRGITLEAGRQYSVIQ